MTLTPNSARITFNPPLTARGESCSFQCEILACSVDVILLRWPDTDAPKIKSLNIEIGPQQSCKIEVSHWTTDNQLDSLWTGSILPTKENQFAIVDLMGRMRKSQHLNICQNEDVESSDRFTGFENLNFIPRALPSIGWEQLDTTSVFLNKRFDLPLLITGMTGGVAQGQQLNYRLATVAQEFKIPMGVGSQRIAIENPDLAKIFRVKDAAPALFLIGNLGAAQLRPADGLDFCKRAVEMIDADALAIHLNVVQELVQAEGDRNYAQLIETIANICQKLGKPVIVKEVGNGMDIQSASMLIEAGVSAIDVGGRGGTSWGYIEGLRSNDQIVQQSGRVFRNWGIPTANALAAARNHVSPSFPIIATGGIRDGITVAKAVALGASLVGLGLPLMRAALESTEKLAEALRIFEHQLRTTMMATSSQRLSDLSANLTSGHPYHDELKHRVSFLQDNPKGG